MSSLDRAESVAVIVTCPPSSGIELVVAVRLTEGGASPSMMVAVTGPPGNTRRKRLDRDHRVQIRPVDAIVHRLKHQRAEHAPAGIRRVFVAGLK